MAGADNKYCKDIAIYTQFMASEAFPRLHKNVYLDPTDGKPYRVQELSPTDKGHVYRYKQVESGGFLLYTPYRVFDLETQAVVQSLPSFTAAAPLFSTPKKGQKASQGYFAWQHFYLSDSDFATFRIKVAGQGWVLKRGLLDVQELLQEVKNMQNRVRTWMGIFEELSAYAEAQKILEEDDATDKLNKLVDERVELAGGIVSLIGNCVSWDNQLDAKDGLLLAKERVQLESLASIFSTVNVALIRLNVQARITEGRARVSAKTLGGLRDAVSALADTYPIMRAIKINPFEGTMTFSACGGELKYDGTEVEVLSPFTKYVEESGSPLKTKKLS